MDKHATTTISADRAPRSLKSGRNFQLPAPRLRRSVILVRQALRSGAVGLAAFQLFAFTPPSLALPTGEVLMSGTAAVSRDAAEQNMQINQSSEKAILNWTGFSIAPLEAVNITQTQGPSSILLNRVTGSDPSQIFGALTANGRVFLVNPNGVLFGSGASVNVGGLVGSTLDISDDDFNAGTYNFVKGLGGAGSVTNETTITVTAPSSYAALIGPQVTNTGTINVVSGSVALAAGDQVTLNILGDDLLGVSVPAAALGAAVLNPGSITANGGTVFLTARSADELLGTVINNTGIVRATSLIERNGAIILDGGSNGIVSSSGTLETAEGDPGITGGSIQVKGEQVALLTGSQVTSDGGTIAITSTAGTEINGVISTGNDTDNAVVIKAGDGTAAGNASGGDITVGAGTSITVGLGGRATLYTGSIVGSTGVTGLVGSGSGNFRYNSTPATSNFTAALGDGTYAIYREQPILDVTVTSPTTKNYGTDDPASRTFTAAGYVNGDSNGIAGTFQRDGGESVGSYSLTQGTLASDVGYGFSLGTQALAITKADVTATIANQSKTYGEDDPALPIGASVTGLVTATVTDWNGTETSIDDSGLTSQATALTRESGENVGNYDVTGGTFTAPSLNYNAPTYAGSATLDIAAADLTATIANQAKTYGEDDPALPIAASVTGLVDRTVITWNGSVDIDDSGLTSQATALERTAGENVGSYSVIDGTFTAPSLNYNAPTYSGGATLTIGAADLTATIANQSKTYGEDDPELPIAASLTGLVDRTVVTWNGAVEVNDSGLTGQATALTRESGENVGSYDVTSGTFTTPSSNYNAPTYSGSATLAIDAADVTATIANQVKTYGEDDPALPVAASVTGLVNTTVTDWNGTDTVINDSALTSQAMVLTRESGENVGSYDVTGGTFTAPSLNYNAPSYSGSATLAIGATDLTATIANQVKTYGEDDPTLPIAANLTGLVDRTVATWNGAVEVDDSGLTSQATALTRDSGENVGSYDVTGGTFTTPSSNYNAPTYLGSATLEIGAADLTATIANQSKTYGDDDPALPIAASVTGLVNTTVTDWNGMETSIDDSALTSQAMALTRESGENVGSYDVTGGTFTAPSLNYDAPTYLGSAALAISQKPIIVTAQTDTKIYDGHTTSSVAPAITGGLVNDPSISTWNGNVSISDTSGFSQTYDTKDVGTGKTLTASGIVNDGNEGDNYSVMFFTDTTGVITRLDSVNWVGGGGNNLWSNAANWAGGAIPDKANVADVDLNGASVAFDSSVPTLDGTVQVDNVSGGALSVNSGTLDVASAVDLTNYSQAAGITMTGGDFTSGGYTQSGGLTEVGGNLSIASSTPVMQTGGTLLVTGSSEIDAGAASITLTSAGNDFGGTLTLKGTVTKVTDANELTVVLDTGETVVIANASLSSTGDLTIGGTTGDLIAISNGGVLQWKRDGTAPTESDLSAASAILIAGTPSETIVGPGSEGNVLSPVVTYSNLANATGGSIDVAGELVLIADNLPRHPSSPDEPSITADSAILEIASLTPGNSVTIILNGQLRLLADQGVFRFKAGSELPGGVSTLDTRVVQVFIGNVSITATLDELAQRAAIAAAQQSALNSASADARQSFGTDSVTQQIDMGFSGDVGIAPTMGHSVPLEGEILNTPPCVVEAKAGEDCK